MANICTVLQFNEVGLMKFINICAQTQACFSTCYNTNLRQWFRCPVPWKPFYLAPLFHLRYHLLQN